MINSLYNAASNMKKGGIFKQSEFKSILNEATSNENWNISNSKLQVLADHTYNWEDYNVIMKHLWGKVQCKPKEWRRIFKALSCMDYLCKNGAPRVVQEIKDDLYKIRGLQDFNFSENGVDRGQGVRDKSRELCELLSDPNLLQTEREFARQTREKLQSQSNTSMSMSSAGGAQSARESYGGPPLSMGSHSMPQGSQISAAGPASGKYGGFGSEDMAKLGYGNQGGSFGNKYNVPYDPYTKEQSAPSQQTFQVNNSSKSKVDDKKKSTKKEDNKKKSKKSKKNKKRAKSSSDSDSASDDDSDKSYDSESDDSDSEDSEEKRRKAKRAKRKNKGGKIESVPKSARQLQGSQQPPLVAAEPPKQAPVQQPAPQQQQPQPSVMDLLSGPALPAPQQQPQAQPNSSGFAFMQPQQPAPQQPAQPQQNMFGGLNMSQPQLQQPQQQNNMFGGLNMGNQAQPQQQQAQPANSAFGFVNQQPAPAQQPQQQQQPQNNNMFGGLNMAQQQPTPQQPAQTQQPAQQQNWDPFSSSPAPQQPPQQQQQPQQQQAQPPQADPFSSGAFGSFQSTPAQPQTNNNSFGLGNIGQPQQQQQPAQQMQQQQQQQQQQAQPPQQQAPAKPKIPSGLFDFDSFKKDQQKINEQKQQQEQAQAQMNPNMNLLQTSQNDTLDSLVWNASQQKPMGQMNMGGGSSFGGSGFGQPVGGQFNQMNNMGGGPSMAGANPGGAMNNQFFGQAGGAGMGFGSAPGQQPAMGMNMGGVGAPPNNAFMGQQQQQPNVNMFGQMNMGGQQQQPQQNNQASGFGFM